MRQLSEIRRQPDRTIEHPTNSNTIDSCAFDAKSDDATREYVHDDHHPMSAQSDRLASEQVHAPKTIFSMHNKGQPGGAIGIRATRLIVLL